MRVAIIHYHLRPGGVTRVIENATRALAGTGTRTVVLCGEPPPADVELEAPARVVPGLDYAPSGEHPREDDLIQAMADVASSELGGDPDVWHFHNHSLGKNAGLTRAVHRMAEQGKRLLLQIHDFAEDGRPHLFDTLIRYVGENDFNRFSRLAYPKADHVHYAGINRRDTHILLQAGAPPQQTHYLPNAVLVRAKTRFGWDPAPSDRLVLYPVRAIRRKNLGETLLWCAAMRGDTRFAVTLAPKSAADRKAYDEWVGFARRHNLPIIFEAGLQSSSAFEEYLASAWLVLSTSIAEGFGLTFLEPWLAGRPVAGRDIPSITQDFKDSGIRLPGMYSTLSVPLEWVDRAALQETLRKTYAAFLAQYKREATPALLAAVEHTYMADDHVDFGRLDERFQSAIIERVLHDPTAASQLRPANLLPDTAPVQTALEHNPRVIHEHYGLQAYEQRLQAIYSAVAGSNVSGHLDHLDASRILDFFLTPEAFWLVRT